MDAVKQLIDENLDRLSTILRTFPTYPNGLTPDEVKFSEEYQKAKKEYDIWFTKLRAYNKEEMKQRKANGTKHYVELYGVKVSRMQEAFFNSWSKKNSINLVTLSPEQQTETLTNFIKDKFPQ